MRRKYQNQNNVSFTKQWKTSYGRVTFFKIAKGDPRFVLEQNSKSTDIPFFHVNGISPALLKNTGALAPFLRDTYLTVHSSGTNNFHIDVIPRMRGGANIIDPKKNPELLWPKGIVYYEIDLKTHPVGEGERKVILQAIKEWNAAKTGFRLVPHTDQADYLVFGNAKDVCNSNVGRQGGRQYIRCDLEGGGFNKRSIKHEIGHAVGLHHEHKRSDRDNYVTVLSDDHANYGKKSKNNSFGEYDFGSIMHYRFGPKLKLKDPSTDMKLVSHIVGNQDRFSTGDLAALRHLSKFAKVQPATESYVELEETEHESVSVYTKLVRIASQAWNAKHYRTASKYYAALYREYRHVVPESASGWLKRYNLYQSALERNRGRLQNQVQDQDKCCSSCVIL